MSASYDVIVVGAGLGGLTAAAALVKAGMRVLVLDRNLQAGGTAAVFRRSGFLFPKGPLGFSSPSIVRGTLEAVGVEEPLKLKRVHYRLRAFGLDLPLSRPLEEQQRVLSKAFPGEAEGIGEFFRRVKAVGRPPGSGPGSGQGPILVETPAAPAREFIAGIIQEDRLKRLLGSQGTALPYAAFPLVAAMWHLMCVEGIWYPEGGIPALADRLRRRLASSGGRGEIKLGSEVAGIRLRQGRVAGVELVSGEAWEAPAVISNADFQHTFLRLLVPEDLPPGLAARVRGAPQTASNLQVSLGLRSDRADLGAFAEAGRLIYKKRGPSPGPPDWQSPEVCPEALAGEEMELALWSRDDPSLAPEGADVLIIRTAAEYGHFLPYRTGRGRRSPSYGEYKMRLGRALMQAAESIIPGLSGAVQRIDVATPLTFEERGGRSGGAVAGWSWEYAVNRDPAPRELIRTPVPGLYMAGYQAYSSLFSGGVPTAMTSGTRAAAWVLAGAGPVGDLALP